MFDDLAFFDSALYASFSQLIIDAFFSNYSEEEFMDLYDICFEVCPARLFFMFYKKCVPCV